MYVFTDVILKDGTKATMLTDVRDIKSAVLVDLETLEREVVTGYFGLKNARKKVHGNSVWSEREIELSKYLEYVGFCPYHKQPNCVYDWYFDADIQFDWVSYTMVSAVDWECKVYFGECKLEHFDNGNVEVIDCNCPSGMLYPVTQVKGYIRDGGTQLHIPTMRYDVDFARGGLPTSFFSYDVDVEIYGTPEYILGDMVYTCKDREAVSAILGYQL